MPKSEVQLGLSGLEHKGAIDKALLEVNKGAAGQIGAVSRDNLDGFAVGVGDGKFISLGLTAHAVKCADDGQPSHVGDPPQGDSVSPP